MRFVVATQDYAGLGFAIRLQDEGHQVLLATNPCEDDRTDSQRRAAYELVGSGMIPKDELSNVMARREEMRDWYWIWDFNHAIEENETLRAGGFKVLGGGRHANAMEHDRHACLEFAATYGLDAPASFPFNSSEDAISFCEANLHTAYVYKPDVGANFETFLPESDDPADANLELRMHLRSLDSTGSFILQERKDGVETNVEVWIQEGEPVFAFMVLESKKKYAMDMGELVGCAFDFAFTIPLDCKAVTDSVGKLYPAYKKMRYTGFADANFIASRDGLWFFEKCERFGYNAHPNLLFNLSRRGLGEVFSSLVEGNLKPDFSGGFGATVTMSTKANPVGGKSIQFPSKLWKDIYWWDVYKKDEHYLTAGYDRDGYVLIVTAYGYTIPNAWEKLMSRAAQIKFPYRNYRPDGDRTDYPSSPIRRYEALRAMGYI
jgi:phosphoribosylamine-glycine ligase